MENDEDVFGREEILERDEREARTGAELIFCSEKPGEEELSGITDETWLTGGGGRREREEGDGRAGGDGISMRLCSEKWARRSSSRMLDSCLDVCP